MRLSQSRGLWELFSGGNGSLLTLIPMDGPSVCFWPMTAVPQVGQNLFLESAWFGKM